MATIRQQRVAGLLFEELSIMVGNELNDPRLSFVNVTNVVISRDLRNAKVFVYHQDEENSRQDVLNGLQKATPFLRSQLAVRCGLRVVPELLFYYDDSPEKAARIDQLLMQIANERMQRDSSHSKQESAEQEASVEKTRANGDGA